MIAKKNLLSHLKTVDGFLRDDEALLLYDLAKKAKGVIVEIGSWKGKSTICLASATDHTVYTIDPHTGSPEHKKKFGTVNTFTEFKKNIQEAELRNVKPLKSTSAQAAKKITEPINLLFIDGDHSYAAVAQDFDLYYPKLDDGGVIAFHDTISWSGPRRLVTEKLYFGTNFKNIHLLGSITCATKTSHLKFQDRMANYYAYALRQLRNITVLIPTPRPIRNQLKKLLQELQ